MVAALKPPTNPFTYPGTALASALSELRVSERATSITLSVLVFVDDTFWVAHRWTQTTSSASSGVVGLCDMSLSVPTRWDPPSELDPRGPRPPRGIVESNGCRAALLVSDRTVLGVIELHGSCCGTPRRERADMLTARIATHLAAWVAAAPDPHTRLVIGPRGVSLHARNVSPQNLPALAALAASRERRTDIQRIGLGLATVELEPLDGPAGPHMLVTVSRPSFYVVQDDLPLTSRQREVADLASHGRTIGEIALVTCCTPNTIKSHLKSIYRVLGVANRIELRELLDAR